MPLVPLKLQQDFIETAQGDASNRWRDGNL